MATTRASRSCSRQDRALNIFEAAATGQTARVRELIAANPALLNAYAPDGFHPLGLAAFFGNKATVEVLLQAGARRESAVARGDEGQRAPLGRGGPTSGHRRDAARGGRQSRTCAPKPE